MLRWLYQTCGSLARRGVCGQLWSSAASSDFFSLIGTEEPRLTKILDEAVRWPVRPDGAPDWPRLSDVGYAGRRLLVGHEPMQPSPDEIVAGKYRLARLIGRGGMGTVWEGVHVSLGTRVAVKFIDAAVAESAETRQRFENEARAAARLNSKYAVQVYDHGLMDDGRPFIVMEYLNGEPLDARLDREGRIPPMDTARIISQVCRALSRAHAAGIVHRDLKPENVFLVWDDEDQANVAKVVDFGIAKFTDNQMGAASSTRTGSLLGTPYFMSPEQARGLRTVDFHTDLWSLGVIAYRCIVGELPFDGVSVGDLLVKICTAPVPVASQQFDGCPPGFDAWVARALHREPEHRFNSVQELAEQLQSICGGYRASMTTASSISKSELEKYPGSETPTIGGDAVRRGAVAGVTADRDARTTSNGLSRTATASSRNRLPLGIAAAAVAGVVGIALFLLFRPSPSPSAIAGETTTNPVVIAAATGPSVASSSAVLEVLPQIPSSPPAQTTPAASVASPGVGAPKAGPVTAPPSAGGTRGPRTPGGTASGASPRRSGGGDNRPIDVGY